MDFKKKQSNQKITMKTHDGKIVEIPEEGSLGLLAVGHRGIIAWRQAKQAKSSKKEQK